MRKGNHVLGIGLRVRRERLIHRLRQRNKQLTSNSDDLPTTPFEEQSDRLPLTLPTQHYHMSVYSRQKVQLAQWLYNNRDDPALLVSTQCTFIFLGLIRCLEFLTTSQEPPFVTSSWLQV